MLFLPQLAPNHPRLRCVCWARLTGHPSSQPTKLSRAVLISLALDAWERSQPPSNLHRLCASPPPSDLTPPDRARCLYPAIIRQLASSEEWATAYDGDQTRRAGRLLIDVDISPVHQMQQKSNDLVCYFLRFLRSRHFVDLLFDEFEAGKENGINEARAGHRDANPGIHVPFEEFNAW